MAEDAAEQRSEEIVDLLEQEWASIDALCADLDEGQWKTPVALPGWSVQDCVSHVLGTEASLLGDPMPDVDVSHLGYVTDPFQQIVEVPVEHRRSWPGAEVLDDYRQVIPRRLEQLRAMTTEQFDEVGWTPLGEAPYRSFMGVRVFDCWMHEQDIRRALDRPGHLSGPVVEAALNRFRAAVPYVVGKKAGAPDGATVVFEVTGAEPRVWTIAVIDGRAKLVGETTDERPDGPTATITVPFESFVALGGGRWNAGQAREQGGLSVAGDTELAERIVGNLAFTP
jgi:uncharacterized protein (TIGR03083 family)